MFCDSHHILYFRIELFFHILYILTHYHRKGGMLNSGEVPFPKNETCKLCVSRPCRRLFTGSVYPGKMVFAHHSEFQTWPCHVPNLTPAEEQAEEAALTDELVVTTGKVTVTNPRWEHADEDRKSSSPDTAMVGDTVILMVDVSGVPEGSPVTFDVFDVSTDPPFRIGSAKGKNEGGTAKGEWEVEDPNEKGEELKLEFEGVAKSKASERCEVKIKSPLTIAYQIDVDAPSAKDDLITLEADDGSWKHEIKVADLQEFDEDWVMLVFPDVPEGKTFNLIQDPGAEGDPFYIWQGMSYDDLFKGEEGD